MPPRSQHIALGDVTLHTLTQGDPDRPMMLFLHGFPEYSGMWCGLMNALSDRFFCVAPDQRGYNLSSKPASVGDYETPKIAADAVALIERFSPGRPVHLVGHDWGAAVAYAVAMARPDLLDNLVIVNGVHPGPFQQALIDQPEQIAASQYFHAFRAEGSEARFARDHCAPLFRMFGAFSDTSWMTPDQRAGYLAAWQQPGALNAMLNWYRASPIYVPGPDEIPSGRSNPFADPARLRVRPRHLLIWGMQDAALTPSTTHGLDAYCDDLTRIEIPEGDHWVVNALPEPVTQAVREFCSR